MVFSTETYGLAAARVETELARVTGDLPEGTKQPLIFRITDAAHAAVVLAVGPAETNKANVFAERPHGDWCDGLVILTLYG